jgi:hypothetical protein
VKSEVEHFCIGSAPLSRSPASSLSWPLREVPKILDITRITSTRAIINAVRLHFGQEIQLWQAQLVKAFVLHDTLAQHREQFFLHPSYLDALSEANDGVYHYLQVDEVDYKFHRVFVCPQHSCGSFVMSLPIVALDRTFLKTRFRQTLLVAVARDVNNEGYLLTWVVVESVSAVSWGFFLYRLLLAIPEVNSEKTTIISDRDKGLAAVDDKIPLAKRAWCCWHIAKNVRKNHGDASEIVFWQMVHARDEPTWDACLRDIAETRDGATAVSYLLGIDKMKWASKRLPGRRWGHLTSNVAEQLNNTLRSDRELPTIELLDAIWNR